MHSRFFRTVVATSLLPSSARQFSFLGNMDTAKLGEKVDNGGLSPGGQTDSNKMRADNVSKQPKFMNSSDPTYEVEWPPLSAGITPCLKYKRTGDLSSAFGPGLDKDLMQLKTEQDDSSLPSSFGKKHTKSTTRRSKVHRAYPPYRVQSGKTNHSKSRSLVEPFDICLSERQGSSLFQKSRNSFENTAEILRPGMVLLKGYVALSKQVELVTKCRELGIGPGGFYQPGYQDGARLRLQMMCLGLNWNPQTREYDGKRSIDGSSALGIPREFCLLVKKAIQDSQSLIKRHFNVNNAENILPAMSPDICIANFYTTNGRLGLHKDRDESKESLLRGLPVVSISVGDSAEFLYGDERNIDKADKVILESGDVLIFGGKSRHIFHGVTSIIAETAPSVLLEKTNLRPGRLNLTFRKF